MGTYMICGILIIVIVAALLGSRKHFKGEGGCCGGGGDVKIKPKHLDTIVATKKLHIEGMSCVNCQNRIENALNGIDLSGDVTIEFYATVRTADGREYKVPLSSANLTDGNLKSLLDGSGFTLTSGQ